MGELVEAMNGLGKMTNYYRYLYKYMKKYLGERILDIGCGYGTIMNYIKGKEVYGIDNDKYGKEKAIKRFKKFYHMDICDKKNIQILKKHKFDTVFSMNVLEHTKDDISSIKNTYDILEEDGRFIIFVPALPFLYSYVDKAGGHIRRYSKKELIGKLKKAGFKIERIDYIKFFDIFLFLIWGKLFKKPMSAANSKLLIYDKFIPLIWSIEDLIKLPIGSSLFCVCRK